MGTPENLSEPTAPAPAADGAPQPPTAPPAEPATEKLRLTKPHPLIQRMLEKEPPKPETHGYYRQLPSRPEVDVRVSKGQRRSALIVMDRLFKNLEARGLKVEVSEGHGYGSGDRYEAGTYATSAGGRDRARLSISEEYKKVPHVPTAKELRDKERDKYGPAIPKYDDVPTGKLTLSPGGVVDLSTEAALGRVAEKAALEVMSALDRLKVEREAREEAQRREYCRQQEESAEKARVEALHKASAAMHRYRELMDYIAEVRRFGRVPADQKREGQTLEEWLRWAEWQARIIHPLG